MIQLIDLPVEIIVDIVSFIPSFNVFILKEVNSLFYQLVSKYFKELTEERWICSFQNQNLWEHFQKNYNKPYHFNFILTELINNNETEKHLIRDDFFISFKPIDLPLNHMLLKRFVTNGRVDLLDFYLENDSHLELSIDERLNRFPFEFNKKLYESLHDREESWIMIALDCIFSSTMGVLEWFEKHFDIFSMFLGIPSNSWMYENIRNIIDKLYPYDEYLIHEIIRISSQSLLNLDTKDYEMSRIFHELDLDYVMIDLSSLDHLKMLNNLFPIRKHHMMDALSRFFDDFLKKSINDFADSVDAIEQMKKIEAFLHQTESILKTLDFSDFLLAQWNKDRSEIVFLNILNESWKNGIKFIEKWEIDPSIFNDIIWNFDSSSEEIVVWLHQWYIKKFKGNQSILRVCCNSLFKLTDVGPNFYNDRLNYLEIDQNTVFPIKDLTSFSEQAVLWIYNNVPHLYHLDNVITSERGKKFSDFVETQSDEIKSLLIKACGWCDEDLDGFSINVYYKLKESKHESLIEPILNLFVEPGSLSDFHNFDGSVSTAIQVHFLKKLGIDPEDIFYHLIDIDAYREFKKEFPDFKLNGREYLKEDRKRIGFLAEMVSDGVILPNHMKESACDIMILWGKFHFVQKIMNSTDSELLKKKLDSAYDKNFVKMVLEQLH